MTTRCSAVQRSCGRKSISEQLSTLLSAQTLVRASNSCRCSRPAPRREPVLDTAASPHGEQDERWAAFPRHTDSRNYQSAIAIASFSSRFLSQKPVDGFQRPLLLPHPLLQWGAQKQGSRCFSRGLLTHSSCRRRSLASVSHEVRQCRKDG
ncbi:hypothetical protein K469DRAFT_392761 [Zopfia rhizophila CBS 207.26]|uniref:Uncharacterized protein n=1 Tax=Zopfia rhizophila CBS 207.26 TaxID=1314779 RepID=A0A6A6EIR2_9PEZI|nr:hypothetical protein K469DRAFT_392761 [Zopfia rhizophila CBS 207.26]